MRRILGMRHGVNGLVVEPDPAAVGAAIAELDADRTLARTLGEAGRELARGVSWDAVVTRLVGHG